MAVNNAMRNAMKALHITQKQLAENLNVSQATISSIVNNTTQPSEKLRRAIATALCTSCEELFGTADEWKQWPEDFVCPRCNSRAISEFYNHADGSYRFSCGFCGLDTGDHKGRENAMRLLASYAPTNNGSGAAELAHVRVLSVAELLDSSAFDSDDIRPVWFENRGLFCCPALLQYGLAERERDCVRVEWHNSFGAKSFELKSYGSWWRCWNEKPTIAQSDSIDWI